MPIFILHYIFIADKLNLKVVDFIYKLDDLSRNYPLLDPTGIKEKLSLLVPEFQELKTPIVATAKAERENEKILN